MDEKEKQEEEERKKQERAKEAAKYCITLYKPYRPKRTGIPPSPRPNLLW